jgi:hypothetical protein
MQGHGNTINYQSSQPSIPWSGRTTEFDDALLQRGIVTPQQVFLAKGASNVEAERLARAFWTEPSNSSQKNDNSNHSNHLVEAGDSHYDDNDVDVDVDSNSDNDDADSIDDDDDDEYMQRYRQNRIQEMEQLQQSQRQQQLQLHPTIRHITRDEWTTCVNQASMKEQQWVIVALTNHSCHDMVVQELHQINRQLVLQLPNQKHDIIKWVTISAIDAIANWPTDHVPTLFAYREGIKQYQWIAASAGQWPASLLHLLQEEWKIV